MNAEQGPAAAPVHSGLDVLALLVRERRLLIGLPLITLLSALAFSLLLPRLYAVESRFTPESSSSSLSRFAGLAGQLGFDLPTPEGGESLDFYAELLESRELLRELALTEFRFEDDGRTLDGNLVELLEVKGDSPDERVRNTVEVLEDLVTARPDNAAQMVTLESAAPWPALAVEVNGRIIELVQEFNVDRRQTRAAAERQFTEARLAEAQAELTAAEDQLARFLSDNRRFEESPQLVFQNQRLQQRVAMRQELYRSLVQGYEQARLDEVRNTPVITVIDPPRGPAERVSPNFVVNGLLGLVLGLLLAIGLIAARAMLRAAERSDPAGLSRLRSAVGEVGGPLRRLRRGDGHQGMQSPPVRDRSAVGDRSRESERTSVAGSGRGE